METIEEFRPDRRRFLQCSLGMTGLGAIWQLSGCHTPSQKPTSDNNVGRWAFLADTHIPEIDDRRTPPKGHCYYDPHENLQRAVERIQPLDADGAVICGDLARLEGRREDYQRLKPLLAPLAPLPVLPSLGNHDDRDNYIQVFGESTYQQKSPGKYVTVRETPVVRVIALDTLFMVNKVPGLLGKAQRDWLAAYLQQCDPRPTILCVHHTLGDGDGDLLDVPRLFELIRPQRQVKAILFGHSHAYGISQWEGIHLINLPALGYSFHPTQPVGWMEGHFHANGGEFMLHVIDGPREKDGHVSWLKWRKS
ncbi:MAG: metallophosphoesterase [Sedimentisphaerales bacterium]|nr:metallophosphoesterase [Sedimentisphaerales bacterium]